MKTGKNLGRTRLGKQTSHAPLTRISGNDRSQAGTTLVELMIAMIISSIVVFFLFTIQSRMSQAYNGQGTVSEITQNLQAARQMLVRDIRMAGYGLGNGTVSAIPAYDGSSAVDIATGLISLPGFEVTNDANLDGNDSFRLLFGFSDDNISIASGPGLQFGPVFINYQTPDGSHPNFPAGTTIIIAGPTASCILTVTNVETGANKIHFVNSGLYNSAPNSQCDDVRNGSSTISIKRLVSRSYRIDPTLTRLAQGYLQMSPSGEAVANDWVDMGVGFTNLQIATRYFEDGDTEDTDGDLDPERDWYSGANQATIDPTVGSNKRPDDAVLIQVSLSLEGRGAFGSKGSIPSITTPAFIDMAYPDHNSIGDWGQTCATAPAGQNPCGIHLALVPTASRTGIFERYQGEHVYRYIKATVDLRNMGIGVGN